VWRRGTPEWTPRAKWQGSDEPRRYWKRCEARLARKCGVDPEDARCRFLNCDCLQHLPEWKREELRRLDAARKIEGRIYKEKWMRLHAERKPVRAAT
jgi:hypothetical protein